LHFAPKYPSFGGHVAPQLFQQVEPNFGAVVTIITCQADHDLVIAHQSSLEAEIHQVLADGEEDKLFTDSSDGIWFGSINKNRGTLSVPSMYLKDDADYSSHLQRVMNSPPPNKRPITLPKWGGGIPNLAPTPVPTIYPAPHASMNSAAVRNTTASINHHFDVIVAEINQQRECNVCFDTCISSLEVTTSYIDQKMDCLLDRLASSIPSPRIPKNSPTSVRETTPLPGCPSPLQTNQDPNYHGQLTSY
jgi:hypothetical protein